MYHTTHTFRASEPYHVPQRSNQLIMLDEELTEPLLFRSAAENQRIHEYVQRYVCMGLWLLYILAGYLWTRAWTPYGIPYDAAPKTDAYELAADLFKLVQFGFVLGWFTQATQPSRFEWLFSGQRWYAHVAFMAASPVYGALSNVPALRHSLVDVERWGVEMWIVAASGLVLALASVGFHAYIVIRKKRKEEIAVYILSRVLVLGVLFGAATALKHSSHSLLHLHHYFIFWLVALFAEFNHPVSALTLLIATSLFVQGVAAYSFAPIWEDPTCLATHSSTHMTCEFKLDEPFQVRMCPFHGSPAPFVHCHAGAPNHPETGAAYWTEPHAYTRLVPGGPHASSEHLHDYERLLETPDASDFNALLASDAQTWVAAANATTALV